MTENANIKKIAREYVEHLLSTETKTPDIPRELGPVTIRIARSLHDTWLSEAKGYTYYNEELLVPFEKLAWYVQEEYIRNAGKNIVLLLQVGCTISNNPNAIPATEDQLHGKIFDISEHIHDSWVRSKAKMGYSFAETYNDDPEKGPLTHRAMLPFHILMDVYPRDTANAKQAAKDAVNSVLSAGFIISVV